MIRALSLVAVLAGSARAASADPACPIAAADPSPHAVAVVLDMTASPGVMLAAPGTTFPTVSDDGTTIVDLFHDASDPSEAPQSTLQTFTRRGAGPSVRMSPPASGARLYPAQIIAWTRTIIEANTLLAKHRWRALPDVADCGAHDGATIFEPTRYPLGDGAVVTFDPSTGGFSATTAGATHALAARFSAPGADAGGGGDGCGQVIGLDHLYGARAAGFAVAVPSSRMGDSCTDRLTADTAVVLTLP